MAGQPAHDQLPLTACEPARPVIVDAHSDPLAVRRWSRGFLALLKTAFLRWERPIWLGLSLVGGGIVVLLLANPTSHGLDAISYWTIDPANPYAGAIGNLNAPVAMRYAPPFVLALLPAQNLSWPVFVTGWTLLCLAALGYISRRWALAMVAFYPVAMELSAGNVNLLIGAAVVAGFRWPATWSFVLLTKVTPGIGLAWFAVRREWRSLAIALGTTALLLAVAFVLAPAMLGQWIAALRSMIGVEPEGLHVPIPLPVRVVLALLLVIWGARTNRRWTVLGAATLAMPTIWMASLAPLAGLVVLTGVHESRQATVDPQPAAPPSPSLELEASG
jgi:Glycosyltransferase family 87